MVTMQFSTQIRGIAMLQRRLHPWQVGWRSCAACRGKDLSCGTTRSTGCTYKSSGMLPINNQQAAAIIDESLQVMVRRDPPRREVSSAWWKCTLKTLSTTGTPECRILPGQKEPALVVPLTRLWDKLSRFLPFCS